MCIILQEVMVLTVLFPDPVGPITLMTFFEYVFIDIHMSPFRTHAMTMSSTRSLDISISPIPRLKIRAGGLRSSRELRKGKQSVERTLE